MSPTPLSDYFKLSPFSPVQLPCPPSPLPHPQTSQPHGGSLSFLSLHVLHSQRALHFCLGFSSPKCISWDFPGGPVVKNLPCNAGDAGLLPGQRTKIPHAAGQLSPHATTTELPRLNWSPRRKLQSPRALEPECHTYRAHTPWSPRTPQLEKRKSACGN